MLFSATMLRPTGAHADDCPLGGPEHETNPVPNHPEQPRFVDLGSARAISSESTFAKLTVFPYPERLLQLAGSLLADGEFSVAIVVAHMACEISAERALSQAFKAKGIAHLQKRFDGFFSGYNLSNEKVRNLYNAVTEDKIQDQPFWTAFEKSAERRQRAVHRGYVAPESEARASVQAATEFVAHMLR
jgi:hypothetical protein